MCQLQSLNFALGIVVWTYIGMFVFFTFTGENQCITGNHNCSSNSSCHITEDGYNCSCASGFQGDGFQCTGT